jgi:oxalate decarboxylase/phosphoglucose isomerase-like protein (cupin superfamily)
MRSFGDGPYAISCNRERAFEVRTMQRGDLVLVKSGQFHALINTMDENMMLFMLGGYD